MIKNIHSNQDYFAIHQSYSPAQHQFSPGALSAGDLRYNPNNGEVEVYNGLTWHVLANTVTINLTTETTKILEWARDKMQQDAQLKDLMARHPGLKDLNDKFEIMKVLCMEEEKQ
jgi:hypothetical protein